MTGQRNEAPRRVHWRHAWLPLLLITIVLTESSCRAPENRRALEEPLALSTEASTVLAPSATATLTPAPTATPLPATQVPPTPAPPSPTSASPTGPTVGSVAPGIALQDLEGETVDLAELQGKVVLLNFWTTW